MIYDWWCISKRLRRKIFQMEAAGLLYGYKVFPIGGHWTIYLIRMEDVYAFSR